MKACFSIVILLGLGLLLSTHMGAYTYCGFHDGRHQMRVYYFNSEFWVDMVVQESRKWDAVHPILSIDRTRTASFPANLGDDQNIIGWLSDADLQNLYGESWGPLVRARTYTRKRKDCGLVLETDLIFNPVISIFTPQTDVPYSLGFQEIVLHELGHVLTLGHEERGLALMAAAPQVSDVLHHNEKVGWIRSAAQAFNPLPTPREDMGVFPLRKQNGSETYSSLSPSGVSAGDSVTINDFSVENLSSVFPFTSPRYQVVLEKVSSGSKTNIGSFSWGSFNPFSSWSGSLTYTVPRGLAPGDYRVTAVFDGTDSDSTNDHAVFGTLTVF